MFLKLLKSRDCRLTGLTEFQTGLIRVICGHILVKSPNLKDNHLTSVKQKGEDIHKGKKSQTGIRFSSTLWKDDSGPVSTEERKDSNPRILYPIFKILSIY